MPETPAPASVPPPRRPPPGPPPAQLATRLALAVVAVAALAAVVVPGSRAGLGLATVAVCTVVVAARAVRAWEPWRIAFLALAAPLAAMPFVRDAGWLLAFDLGAALLLCGTAVAGGSGWRSVLRTPAVLARAVPNAPIAVFRGSMPAAPTGVVSAGTAQAAIRGTLLGGGLVLVFGALFVSADGAFAELVGGVVPGPGLFDELPARLAVALGATGIAGGLALTAAAPVAEAPGAPVRRSLSPTEWTIALGALAALFAAFVAVQFVVLFGGSTHVLETAGLTYADYAHSGFGQLLVASGLVLAVIAGARRWSRVETAAQDRALRALLVVLCACALVVVASALHRLDIYVDAFGATRLRVLAATCCALIGGLLALVLAAVATDRHRWLPRATVLLAGGAALAISLGNPDAWIAERNVERLDRTGHFDPGYAATLSADATPALAGLPTDLADQVLAAQRARLTEDDGPFGLNLARERARELLPPAP